MIVCAICHCEMVYMLCLSFVSCLVRILNSAFEAMQVWNETQNDDVADCSSL